SLPKRRAYTKPNIARRSVLRCTNTTQLLSQTLGNSPLLQENSFSAQKPTTDKDLTYSAIPRIIHVSLLLPSLSEGTLFGGS
ncbi:MAG: hypothetical protein P8078_00630, partial [bacterium]